jgi:hypothetical protein
MDILSMIDLWRECGSEANAQAARLQDGSISNILLLTIAESYLRTARSSCCRRLLTPPSGPLRGGPARKLFRTGVRPRTPAIAAKLILGQRVAALMRRP